MVHDVRAALPATVVVTEHRAVHNQSAEVTRALAEHGAQAMVTGQLLWAEFGTGRTEFINAGHVWPLLLRDGGLEELTPAVDLPFGIALHTSYQVQSLHCAPATGSS